VSVAAIELSAEFAAGTNAADVAAHLFARDREHRTSITAKYSATIWMRSRIASPEMFLNAEPLPHVICSRRAKERRGNGEAIEHGNA
jgi:hypothetical protein